MSTSAARISKLAVQNGPIYFWRETDAQTGWLSQWWPCAFRDDKGVVYKTAEHYMMHHKAMLFNDPAMADAILKAGHPRKVKSMGRKVKNFDPAVWDAERERIVREGSYFKFTRAVSEDGLRLGASSTAPFIGKTLRELLLSTHPRELVEASPFDAIWGIGLVAKDADPNHRDAWGLNLLGKALMDARERFVKEDEEKEREQKE
ncbi:hypothetical protein QBC46DRAFT_256943 [Diplogelasinospora grovesii]|uniref:NADAR domain-containing protein n=1 Tax=Diplogelasinospora grovesii TaxID=303347 RepID=A0AAN6S6C6_9PEZI|nr:hypothetical protein QBC46DRAFT_256943 [Diplogelasinospora grovesii]